MTIFTQIDYSESAVSERWKQRNLELAHNDDFKDTLEIDIEQAQKNVKWITLSTILLSNRSHNIN